VSLSLQSRRVGDISVVKCSGRIVEGDETAVLRQYLNGLLPRDRFIILDLGQTPFIDSGGLGLLVRFLARFQTAGGNLELCAVPARIAEVLKITRLASVFESHESEADAIAAFYQPTQSAGKAYRFNTEILCVEKSADVLAYVGALLQQAGYGVVTTGNLADARTLLTATQTQLVVIGAEFRPTRGTPTAETFNRLANVRSVVELPADFSSHEAGEAGHRLLDHVRAVLGDRDRPATATL
jgi:anti-sigma B factor antagonist